MKPKTIKHQSRYEVPVYSREYVRDKILSDIMLFDLRCWPKPKKEIDSGDVLQWIAQGCIPSNCGHATMLIRTALMNGTFSIEEMVNLILSNKYYQSYEDDHLETEWTPSPGYKFIPVFWWGDSLEFPAWVQLNLMNRLVCF